MQNNNWIYPKRELCLPNENKKLAAANISDSNKDLIKGFQEHLSAKKSKKYRISKLTAQIRRLTSVLETEWLEVSKKDLVRLVAYVNTDLRKIRTSLIANPHYLCYIPGKKIETKLGGPASEATKADYRRAIKQFMLWVEDEDERLYSSDPRVLLRLRKLYKYVKEIDVGYKDPYRDPNQVLCDEDIQEILEKGCESLRDRALISFLYHTGVRAGELLNIRMKDITINEKFGEIAVNGKTGQRPVWIDKALPYLVQYIEAEHPDPKNLEAFLWVGKSNRYKNTPLAHTGCRLLVARCFKKAKISKRHNLHWFRHSRATWWMLEFGETILCELMGWVPGSKQVKRYVHLTKEKVRKKYLAVRGLITEEGTEAKKPIICVCGQVNDCMMRYCFRCGKPLSINIILEDKNIISSETNKTVQLLMNIMKNPELLKQFEKFKEEQRLKS